MRYYNMYGRHAVLAALSSGRRKIDKIFCSSRIFEKNSDLIKNYQYKILDNKSLDNLICDDQNTKSPRSVPAHQGIIARVSSVFENALSKDLISSARANIAIIDQVSDTQNIGAIMRNAAAFGFSGIVMTKDHCPLETASIAKTSSGTIELLEVASVTNLSNYISKLQDAGFWIIGFDGTASDVLSENIAQNFPDKIAMVFGSEAKGMRDLTKKRLDFCYKIPIAGQVESLNVASTTAIAFYIASLKRKSG